MPRSLDQYHRQVDELIVLIRSSFAEQSSLRLQKTSGIPTLGVRIGGDFRRDRLVMKVKEHFNFDPQTGSIDKDYRYIFLFEGQERLRIETQPGQPEHAHFPPLYIANSNRHFNISRWPPDLQDMDFVKAFEIWSAMRRLGGGQLPEPFRSTL